MLTPGSVRAAGWAVDASGNWSNPSNWSGGVPNGVDQIADFTLNATNDITVTLDVAATVGQLNFADGDVASPAGWTIAGAQTLTLEGAAAPTITVLPLATGKIAAISAALGGTQGFTKQGDGTLQLSGTNAISGNAIINAGTVSVTGGSLAMGVLDLNSGANARFVVDGGNVTFSGASDISGNTNPAGFRLLSGSVAFDGGLGTSGNFGPGDGLVRIEGGTFTASNLTISRNSAGSASFTSGLVMTGGDATVGTFQVGSSNSNGAASIEGGNFTATGAVTIARQATGGRGGHLRVTGGTFTSTDTVDGVILARQDEGGNVNNVATATFSGGISTVEKFKMGYDANVTAGSATLNLSGGTLYIGSGGIEMNGTGLFNANVNLTSGTLGAKGDWTGAANVNLPAANTVTIKAADAADVAHNITLSGVIAGDGTFTKTGGGTLLLSGANTWTGGATVSTGTLAGRAESLRGNIINNANVAFDEVTSGTFTGMISGPGSVTKTGPGTSIIANAQTYTGPTTVNQGILGLVGTHATSGVDVSNGGGLSVAAGDATINALTLGSSGADAMTLVVNGGSGINTLTVTNTDGLVANGMTTIDVGAIGLTAGQHTILDYSGTIGGNGFGSFALGTLPPRVTASLANNVANTSIDLMVSGVDFPRWTGQVNGDWDINNTQNWKEFTSGNTTVYLETTVPGDQVLFDDSATGTTTVNLTTTVQPSLVTFSNDTKTYTLTGPGNISGPTSLIKQGAGTAIISNVGNSYTGGTMVQAGTLQLGAANVLPAGGAITASGGTLDLGAQTHDISGALTVSGGTVSNGTINKTGSDYDLQSGTVSAMLSGTAGISKTGSGTAVLLGTNHNYTGLTVVSEGALQFGDGTSNGSVPGAGFIQGDMPNITNSATVIFNNGSDQAYTGSILGTSGTVIKNGPGTLTLSGVNSGSGNEGNAIVNDGTVVLIGEASAINPTHAKLGRGGTLTINNGATVSLQLFNALGLNSGFQPPHTIINTGGTLRAEAGSDTAIYNITLAGGNWTGDPSAIWNLRGDVQVTAPNSTITVPSLNMFNDPDFTVADGASLNVTADLTGGTGINKHGPGTMTLSSGNNTYTGATDVDGGTLIFATSHVNASALNVSMDGVAQLSSDGTHNKVIRTPSVTVSDTGKIDLTDNKLITDTPAGTATGGVYDGVQGLVQSAYNGGAWDGPGITSSVAPTVPAGQASTAIGVATGAQVNPALATEGATALFAGQTITGSSVIAMYTYGGDANLDGLVSGDDYTAIDFAIAVPGASGWVNGDFNYDGIISGDDYTVIDFNIAAQGAAFPTSGAASGVTAVPEPASLSVLGLAAAGLLGRRRRRCK